jgi:hypothetical protein
MNSRILTIEDANEWRSLLSAARDTDVFHRPQYHKLNADKGEEPRLFVAENDSGFIAYPFLKRTINTLDFVGEEDLADTYSDLVTSEYAGPVTNIDAEDLISHLRSFRNQFETYCSNNNIVAEFGRLHPFINSDNPFIETFEAQPSKDIVYVDLQKDEDQIFNEIDSSKQRQIKQARDELRIEVSTDWNTFKEMYDATMERVDAKKRYLYEDAFVEQLVTGFGEESILLLAYRDDQPVSGMIAVRSDKYIHSYLSCSYKEYLDLYGNVLLKYEVINQGKESGCQICNFGGGVDGAEGVFRFKKEFSETTAPFYTYRHTHDKDTYGMLSKLKQETIGTEKFERINFFPAYRGPA